MKKDVRGHSLPTDSLDEVPLPNKHTKKKERERERVDTYHSYIPTSLSQLLHSQKK